MLCLQQVERLTLEGSSFKVPGKGCLFQLAMKRETRCWKSDQTLELMWDCTRTRSGLCYKLRAFSCINDELKFVPSAGVPALLPTFWPWKGVDSCYESPQMQGRGGSRLDGQTLTKPFAFSIPSVHGTQIQWVGKLWWVVWSQGDGDSGWWDTSGTTLWSNFIAQLDPLKKEHLKITFYKTHDLFSLFPSACCLLIANLVVSKEMLKEQFSLMLMHGKYFQHCYTM